MSEREETRRDWLSALTVMGRIMLIVPIVALLLDVLLSWVSNDLVPD